MTKLLDHQDRAYQSVRRKLLEGKLRSPGELSRRKLATELGVSPSCVHSVLVRLENERIVVSRSQMGTFVREVDVEEYHLNYDLRGLIEPYAAGRAAGRASDEHTASFDTSNVEFDEILADMENDLEAPFTVELFNRSVQADHLFHGTVMEAARHPMAAHFLENLRILIFAHPLYLAQTLPRSAFLEDFRRTAREHRAIAGAIVSGDSVKAEGIMREHLINGRFRIGKRFGQPIQPMMENASAHSSNGALS